jgi:hypothetical protein
VLLQDDFSDPNASQLPQTSTDPRVSFSIDSGEYRLQTHDPAVHNQFVRLPGPFGNVAIAIDARFDGDSDDRLLVVGCRGNEGEGDPAGYYFFVLPDPVSGPGHGSVQLLRRDAGWTPLTPPLTVAMRPATTRNHLELSCVGTRIAAEINGKQVLQANDGAYTEGVALLGVGTNHEATLTSDARFSNLEVTQQ